MATVMAAMEPPASPDGRPHRRDAEGVLLVVVGDARLPYHVELAQQRGAADVREARQRLQLAAG